MEQKHEILVQRAQADDAKRIAEFVNRAQQGQVDVDRRAVIARLGEVGFLLAEQDGDLIGVLGWQLENLVSRVTDLLICPARKRLAVGQVLFAAMESAAMELQGEAALLFLPRPTPSELIKFCQTFGYELQALASLPDAWREAAREARLDDDETVLIKQLRSERVVRPL